MKKRNLSLNEFNLIYSKVPRICVELIIKSKKGILLTKRAIKPCKGYWHFPGSTVLFNEKLEQAVKRTAKQELNLDVPIKRVLGHMEYLYPWKNYPKHGISIVFLVHSKTNLKEVVLDNQSSEWKEFKIIPKKLIAVHKKFLQNKKF